MRTFLCALCASVVNYWPAAAAISFDGSDDRMAYADVAAIDGVSALTIACWIKLPDVSQQYETLLSKLDGSDEGWSCYDESVANTINWYQNTSATGGSIAVDWTGRFGAWHHLVIRFDGSLSSADRIEAYVDGANAGLSASGSPTTTIASTSAPLVLADYGASASGFSSQVELAEVCLWTVALTDAQIAALYAKGGCPLGQLPKPAVYLPLVRETHDLIGAAGTPTTTGTTVSDHPRTLR